MTQKRPPVVVLKFPSALRKKPSTATSKPKSPHHQPVHRGGKDEGPPASKTDTYEPNSIHGAWISLRDFGHHVEFNDPSGLKLNGRPIDLDRLMIITNRIRRREGLPMVGKKPEWFR